MANPFNTDKTHLPDMPSLASDKLNTMGADVPDSHDIGLGDCLPSTHSPDTRAAWEKLKEEVRSRTRLEDFIQPQGGWDHHQPNDWWCPSPLRSGDSDPSFHIDPERQVWKDFGGEGKGGDVFEYLQQLWGCSFIDALKRRASELGLPLPSSKPLTAQEQKFLNERQRVEEILGLYVDLCHKALPAALRAYLKDHYGFTDGTIDTFKIGYDPGGLWHELKKLGCSDDEVFDLVPLFTSKTAPPRSFFETRLVFPYWNHNRVVYLIGRATEETPQINVKGKDGGEEKRPAPKYTKLPVRGPERPYVSETIKNDWIFNAEAAEKVTDILVVAEGIADGLSCIQSGWPTISPVTTSFSDKCVPQVITLCRKVKRVVLVPDQERSGAGMAGALKTVALLCNAGIDARIAVLPHEELKRAAEERERLAREAGKSEDEIKKAGDWKTDANEFLVKLPDGVAFKALIEGAPSRLETLIAGLPAIVPPTDIDALLRPIAALIAKRPEVEHHGWLGMVMGKKIVDKRTLGRLLKEESKKGRAQEEREDAEGERPIIALSTNEKQVADAAIEALAKGEPDLYQRANALVRVLPEDVDQDEQKDKVKRPVGSPKIALLPKPSLRETLSAVGRWQADGEDCHVPQWAVEAIHARGTWPGVRRLVGVIEAPCLRPDGTVLDTPGFDLGTGLLYRPNTAFEPVPLSPTLDDAKAAGRELEEVVVDFPFELPAHKAAWLAEVLTGLARPAIDGLCPLTITEANTRGTGKNLLVDTVAVILTGREFPRSAHITDEAEIEKRITSIAMAGDNYVLIDNINGPFGGGYWDAALTSTWWTGRILGSNNMYSGPLTTVFFATGNNVSVTGDTARRVMVVRMLSMEERPEDRKGFQHDPLLPWVTEHRPRLVRAALTMLRAYVVAGCPEQGLRWGSFEAWTRLVASALVWAGYADCTKTRLHLEDGAASATSHLNAFLQAWEDTFGAESQTAATVLKAIEGEERERRSTSRMDVDGGDVSLPGAPRFSQLRDTLMDFCPGKDGRLPSPKSFGNRLSNAKDRVVQGRRLVGEKDRKGVMTWAVKVVAGSAGSCRVSPSSSSYERHNIAPGSQGEQEDILMEQGLPETRQDPANPAASTSTPKVPHLYVVPKVEGPETEESADDYIRTAERLWNSI